MTDIDSPIDSRVIAQQCIDRLQIIARQVERLQAVPVGIDKTSAAYLASWFGHGDLNNLLRDLQSMSHDLEQWSEA